MSLFHLKPFHGSLWLGFSLAFEAPANFSRLISCFFVCKSPLGCFKTSLFSVPSLWSCLEQPTSLYLEKGLLLVHSLLGCHSHWRGEHRRKCLLPCPSSFTTIPNLLPRGVPETVNSPKTEAMTNSSPGSGLRPGPEKGLKK